MQAKRPELKFLMKKDSEDRFRTKYFPKCLGTFPDCPKCKEDCRSNGKFISPCDLCPYGGMFKGVVPKIPKKSNPHARKAT